MWNSLLEFAVWYRDNKFPVEPPADTKVYVTDVSYSSIIFRRGKFQVEQYFMKPNAVVPLHRHDFENITIWMGGQMCGIREGMNEPANVGGDEVGDKAHSKMGRINRPLMAGEAHAFTVGPQGCILFICELWNKDINPTSATEHYYGEPMGPIHNNTLSMLQEN